MTSPLIQLYHGWAQTLLDGPLPRETRATCNQCVMCAKPKLYPEAFEFEPSTKCCSYFPKMPNYLIGGLLSDTDERLAEGKARLRGRIEAGLSNPLGLTVDPAYRSAYDEAEFGKRADLLCPFYMAGNCSVWLYRPGPCQTFFCRHERGAPHFKFWLELDDWLFKLESDLSHWCLEQLGLDQRIEKPLFLVPENAPPPGFDWAEWKGREETFFLACWDLVKDLDLSQVHSLASSEARLYGRGTQRVYQNLEAADQSDQIHVGPYRLEFLDEQYAALVTFSKYDPLMLPREIYEALDFYRSGSLQEIEAKLDAAGLAKIDPVWLKRLRDNEVLLPGLGLPV